MSEKQETHTPGPWYEYQSEKDAHKMIASKCGESIANHVPNENARLIAAAPEMLEMCKLLEECMETIDGKDGYDASYELAKVRAVLAKVEGETA
ncbi:hypothetical protein [uncultured Mediterranean phage uvMED]|nr:hypothetical protein [uncultured Mediterranean phage uvMED]